LSIQHAGVDRDGVELFDIIHVRARDFRRLVEQTQRCCLKVRNWGGKVVFSPVKTLSHMRDNLLSN
jgi:hypothetical protein